MKYIWLVLCESKVYREIMGAYSTQEKSEIAAIGYQKIYPGCGSLLVNIYTVKIEFDREEEESTDHPVLVDWYEFSNKDLCSLCANWGFIDTRSLKNAAGVECGKLNYCICPNGRKMKELKWDIEKEIENVNK